MVFGVETGKEAWRKGSIRIGFAKEQRFQFGVRARGEVWVSS